MLFPFYRPSTQQNYSSAFTKSEPAVIGELQYHAAVNNLQHRHIASTSVNVYYAQHAKNLSLILHFIRITILLSKSVGIKALVAENRMLRKQLIKLSRKQKRSPKLLFLDRLFFESCCAFY